MYILLKPESRSRIDDISEIIGESEFSVKTRHPIKDWKVLANQLYAPQAQESSRFAAELASYLWLTNYFFGNSAVAMTLQRDSDLMDNLTKLQTIKKIIRERISTDDQAIALFLDIDKIDPARDYPIGYRGRLTIEGPCKDQVGRSGRWDDFFFKYVHTPDPSKTNYEREMAILRSNGVYDIDIESKQWSQMARLQTLVCEGRFHDE